MSTKPVTVKRKTKETEISVTVDMTDDSMCKLSCGLPFFEHLLHACAFHGRFSLSVDARGDIEVDPHHVVEDIGIVMGEALRKSSEAVVAYNRYGYAVVPMDDSLSEAVVDVCGRAYLVFEADFPQPCPGGFDVSLIREFLRGLAGSALINIHARCRYGENSHHMAESLFKALGMALKEAYSQTGGGARSTKGSL